MKTIILAGGFAKRMWPLTENQAKSLLPIAGKPVIEHILGRLEQVASIQELYVSTNKKFEKDFAQWIKTARTSKTLSLVVEPHDREEKKMGAIGGLRYFIDTCKIQDDMLVIAGDNIFDFDIKEFLAFGEMASESIVALYDIADIEKVRNRFGVAIVDPEGTIISFDEKPQNPRSTLISTGIYLFKRADLWLIQAYLDQKENPDAPGFFIRWLSKKKRVKGFVFKGLWFDIGSFKLYADANAALKSVKKRSWGFRLKRHEMR